jgi:hypothetical protein
MDLSEPERTSMRRYERWLRVNDPVEPPAASRRPPPGASVLLAVDQELGQGATLRVAQDRPASSPLVSAVVPVRAPGCRRPPRCVGERPLDWPAAGSRTPSSRRGCYVQYPRAVGMPPPPNATIATPTMMARRACLTPEESSEAAAWSTTMALLGLACSETGSCITRDSTPGDAESHGWAASDWSPAAYRPAAPCPHPRGTGTGTPRWIGPPGVSQDSLGDALNVVVPVQ